MPTKEELKALAEDLTPYFQTTENKGGKTTMSEEKRYCPTCGAPQDHRHIVTDLEIEKDRHQHDIEKLGAERDSARQQYESATTELTNALKSLQHHIENYPNGCSDGENCPTNQALHRIAEEAKKNLTPDDLTVDLIGEFFRKRGIIGVARQGKEYKPFKSIQIRGK